MNTASLQKYMNSAVTLPDSAIDHTDHYIALDLRDMSENLKLSPIPINSQDLVVLKLHETVWENINYSFPT
ncbi:hypothetical protein YC2023_058496 [Brassica napus]